MQRAAQAQLKKAGGFDAKTAVDVEDLLPQSHVEKSEPVIVAAVVTDDQEPSTSGLSNNPQGDGNKDEDRLCQVEGKTGDVERRAENENNPVERGNPGHYPKTEEDKERADDISSELIKHLNQGNPVPLLEEVSSTSLDPADLPASQDQDMLVIEPVLPAVISSKPSNPELPKETSLFPESPHTPNAAVTVTSTTTVPAEVVMVDEETRMSAEAGSRAQTPARQMVAPSDVVEESQSSVQSTATTESGKQTGSRPTKAPRLEVQEPEGSVINADQLTEYYWNGNGPFMLQEQVAQYLGIKSFKRKYPSIKRRMLEMQERDFIKENGLASEHMCDLGLTAVNSADILDIMYSDFQEKYEEYCKHQRDRQAKELINKQRALSLAASQDKNKADITQQAVHSAAQWNVNFNRARKEQRRACMDLQTLTVHYPKGRMKKIDKSPVGNYPVALVPGQFTDYYRDFTPTEINNLPLNTMCYNEVHKIPPEESEESDSDGSSSDSDSSDCSSSGSDSSSSSEVEDCKLCKHSPKKVGSGKMI